MARKFLGQKEMSVWFNTFINCRTALKNDPEKHRGRTQTLHTDENCLIVDGSIREDGRVKVGEIAKLYFTSLGEEPYCEESFKNNGMCEC
jgi:hypothetical protein